MDTDIAKYIFVAFSISINIDIRNLKYQVDWLTGFLTSLNKVIIIIIIIIVIIIAIVIVIIIIDLSLPNPFSSMNLIFISVLLE